MSGYPDMYRKLLCSQIDAIEQLQTVLNKLIKDHQLVEEMYISALESEPDVFEYHKMTNKNQQETEHASDQIMRV